MSENTFRKVFDLRKLTEQELGCVEFVLNSPAYIDVFKPYLENVRDSMQKLWLDRSQERKDNYPDDFLAGGVAAIDGLLKFFAVVIHETNMDRVHEAMAKMTPDVQYRLRQEKGNVLPVVGVNQSPEPEKYNPAEDF